MDYSRKLEKILDEKFYGRRLVGRPRHKWEDNNRRYFFLLLNVREWWELAKDVCRRITEEGKAR
jgi:hypothetical protein